MKRYFIENAKGERSKGGQRPQFDKNGKAWHKEHHIINHLIIIENSTRQGKSSPEVLYENCEVVEYELVEVSRKPVQDYIDGYKTRRAKAAADAAAASTERQEKTERELLARLQDKYGKSAKGT